MSRKFTKLCSLKTHQTNSCLNKGKKKYKCENCDKSYANKQRLLDHKAQKHSGEKRYTCEHYKTKFFTNNEAVTHRKSCELEDKNVQYFGT